MELNLSQSVNCSVEHFVDKTRKAILRKDFKFRLQEQQSQRQQKQSMRDNPEFRLQEQQSQRQQKQSMRDNPEFRLQEQQSQRQQKQSMRDNPEFRLQEQQSQRQQKQSMRDNPEFRLQEQQSQRQQKQSMRDNPEFRLQEQQSQRQQKQSMRDNPEFRLQEQQSQRQQKQSMRDNPEFRLQEQQSQRQQKQSMRDNPEFRLQEQQSQRQQKQSMRDNPEFRLQEQQSQRQQKQSMRDNPEFRLQEQQSQRQQKQSMRDNPEFRLQEQQSQRQQKQSMRDNPEFRLQESRQRASNKEKAIDEQKQQQRERARIKQRERRELMRASNPEQYALIKSRDKERHKQRRSNPILWRQELDQARQLRLENKSLRELINDRASRTVHDQKKPEELVPDDVLAQIDNELDFTRIMRDESTHFNDACTYFSYDYLTNRCCLVCEQDIPKYQTKVYLLTDRLIIKLRQCCGMRATSINTINPNVIQDYSLNNYDQRLANIWLSRFGLCDSDGIRINLDSFEPRPALHAIICDHCMSVIDQQITKAQPLTKRMTRGESFESLSKSNGTLDLGLASLELHSTNGSDSHDDGDGATNSPPQKLSRMSEQVSDSDDSIDELYVEVDIPVDGHDDQPALVTGPTTSTEPSDACSSPYLNPPINAIANGNWIGYIPNEFSSITRSEEQSISLMVMNLYLRTIIGSDRKTINDHHFVIKNPNPVIRSIPADVTDSVRFTLVGAFVPETIARMRQRFHIRLNLLRSMLSGLVAHNIHYQEHQASINPDAFEFLEHDNFVIDRTDESDTPVHRNVVRIMQFGISSYNTGTADEAIHNVGQAAGPTTDLPLDENVRAQMIFQPMLASSASADVANDLQIENPSDIQRITDVIAYNTNHLAKLRGVAAMVYCFPSLFYYGTGGFNEVRPVRMTPLAWGTRCMRLHGNRFSQHYGFVATLFDQLATSKAYRSQYLSMRVRESSILKLGLWNKEDIIECVRYVQQTEEQQKRGLAILPPPDKVKALMSIIHTIRPGLSAMLGSDASRGSARHEAFGKCIRFGDVNVFATISPDTAGTYVIAINTGNMNASTPGSSIRIQPGRAERKIIAANDPVQSADYAKRIDESFRRHILGWDDELHGPLKHGGIMGVPRWWQRAAETQKQGDIHFHYIISIVGLPRTATEMTAALGDPLFMAKFIRYIEQITPPHPPLADPGNSCPVEGCSGQLEALPIPGEAFCMHKPGRKPANTSHCTTCGECFIHKDVLKRRVLKYAQENGINTNPNIIDEFRCLPPTKTPDGRLTPTELVYTALSLLEFQFHHETHTKSCFQITSRTPSGWICRFLFPKLAMIQASYLDIETGKFHPTRAIGSEYYNLCSLMWTRLSKNNMDIQFLINGGTRRVSSYTTKYTFKSQNPSTSITLKIGLLSNAFNRTFAAADDHSISTAERGRRVINKALWQFTKPQELHLTMAAFMILDDGAFKSSHNVVYVNLEQICACFPDSNRDEDTDDDENDVEMDHVDTDDDTFIASDDDVYDGDHSHEQSIRRKPKARKGFVDISISSHELRINEDRCEDANEADHYVASVCPLTDYWGRPDSMKALSFARVIENYHIVRSKPPKGLEMHPLHPHPDKGYWMRNKHHERKCLIAVGLSWPNIHKPSATVQEKEFLYKVLLSLFKPTDFDNKLIKEDGQSYQESYETFMGTNSDDAIEAQIQMCLVDNYYTNGAHHDPETADSEEAQILRNHAFEDPGNHPSHKATDPIFAEVQDQYAQALYDAGYEDEDIDTLLHNVAIDSELPPEIKNAFCVTSQHHPEAALSIKRLPEFRDYDDYQEKLIDPKSACIDQFNGTTAFIQRADSLAVKIELLHECFAPVPWKNTDGLAPTTDAMIAALPMFASIGEISYAMRLNFWQHVAFETYARHLLYKFYCDIQHEDRTLIGSSEHPQQSEHIKPQLISYLGGEAGTGKSAVIGSILTFARLWGRRNTVETMAFMGLAGLQIDGDTVHSQRGIDMCSLKGKNTSSVQTQVSQTYLTIIDEISMLGQQLLGSADEITRHYRSKFGAETQPWGGIHIVFAGDFLQLTPVLMSSIIKEPTDRSDESYQRCLAGYRLWNSCNHVVFLTENMRQRHDPAFASLLSRMHFGINTEADLRLLNTRFIDRVDIANQFARYTEPVEDYFAPMAVSLNSNRCLYNKETIFSVARKQQICVYECLATSTTKKR